MKNNNVISNFSIDLYRAESFDECFNVLIKTIQEMGFDGALYTYIPLDLMQPNNGQPIFKVSEAYSSAFIDHYSQANFVDHDFTIRKISQGRTSTIDWWEENRNNRINKNEREVILVAREEYSIRNGLTIPTFSSNREISGVSIISNDSDQIYTNLVSSHLSNLEYIAKIFHSRIHSDLTCKRIFFYPLLESLSAKEREVIKFISTGLPLKVIEDYYQVTPGYAKNIVVNLCKKLGVNNANQLRYVIGLYRIIDLL